MVKGNYMYVHVYMYVASIPLNGLCNGDCLPIEAAYTHTVIEYWAWRMADKFASTFRSAH